MIFISHLPKLPKKVIHQSIYVQLVLFGLNYSFKRVRGRKICLNLQYAFNQGFRLPPGLVARVYKRRLVLFGTTIILMHLVRALINLRTPNIYTGKGLRLRKERYLIKPGKVRRR